MLDFNKLKILLLLLYQNLPSLGKSPHNSNLQVLVAPRASDEMSNGEIDLIFDNEKHFLMIKVTKFGN